MGVYSACKALIIGVSHYADPQCDLSYARSDAEAMAELLRNEFGFDQIWTLYDSDATRQNIIRYFENDLLVTDEDDGLLIFFAGHGITVTSAIGDERGFLMPHDGDRKRPYANLSLTAIRDDYLLMIPAKQVFLIIDACYSGLGLRDIGLPPTIDEINDAVLADWTRRDRKVRQVLAAGTKDQPVLDGGLFGHSIFTGRLIEALREANPYITADHVAAHVKERVARDARDRKHRQNPQFGYLIGGEGTFVFRQSKPSCAAPSVPVASATGPPVAPPQSFVPPPKPIPTAATLWVTSDPPGAEVLVDSHLVGRTPLRHPLDLRGEPQQQVEVVVRKNGHQSKTTMVQLRRGATSKWTGIELAPLKAADLPDPTTVQVQEIVVGPLEVEIDTVARRETPIGDLPPLAPDLMQAAGTLEGLTRTIASLANESHPSLAAARAAVAQAKQQHDQVRRNLEEYGQAIPGYLRRRMDDELRRNPSQPVSGLVALAKDIPQDVVLRYLYGLRHAQHARQVVEQAERSYQQARQTKIDELAIQAKQLRAEVEPRLEQDFAEIMAGVFAKAASSQQFPLDAWIRLEPLLAQRSYPWDQRALLAKAEDLFRDTPDHEAWRRARQNGTGQGYEDYLRSAPNGCHAGEARAELVRLAKTDEQEDDRQWQTVRASKAATAYAGYLSDRPRGRHVAAVRYLQALWARQARAWAVDKVLQKVDSLLADRNLAQAASVLRQAIQRPEYQGCPSLLARWDEMGQRASRRTFREISCKGVFTGHAGRVLGVQITPDGEQAISAGQDYKLRLWDLDSGLCRAMLTGHTRAVLSVTVDVDGRRAVSGSEDSSVRVWDLESHKCVGVLKGHREAVTGARLLADGRHVLSCSDDSTLRLWDLDSKVCLKTLCGHHGKVTAVAMTTAGQCVSAGGQDDTLALWNLQSGTCVKSIQCNSEGVNDVAVSPGGLLAATAGSDKTARLWDLQTGQCVKVLQGHDSRVLKVSFLSEGDRLLTAGRDGTVRLWDVATGRCIRTMEGHRDEVTGLSVAGDDAWAISSSYDQSLRVWDLGTGRCRAAMGAVMGQVTALSPGGPQAVLAGTDKGEVCLLPGGSRHPRVLDVQSGSIVCAGVNTDGTRAVTAGRDRVVQLWDLNAGQLLKPLEGDGGDPVAVGFTSKGDAAMLLSRGGGITRMDLAGGKARPICPAAGADLTCGLFVAEANRAVGGTASGVLVLWDLSSGRIINRVKIANASIGGVALDCTGRRALAAAGQELKLVDLEARKSRALVGHDGPVLSVAFAGDGQLAITGGQDRTVRIWDVVSGACLASSVINGGALLAVAWSVNGGTVAVACADGTVALCDCRWDYDFAASLPEV